MKRKVAALLAAVLMLSGCSAVKTNGTSVTLRNAGIRVEVPSDWSVLTGNDAYQSIAENSDGLYADAKELKKECSESGQQYLALATSADGEVVCTISSYEQTNADGESVAPADYARTTHDSTIFGYLASGYATGGDSSFCEQQVAGKAAWLSHFELYLRDGDSLGAFVLGQTEHLIESDGKIYSVQVVYSSAQAKSLAEKIVITGA